MHYVRSLLCALVGLACVRTAAAETVEEAMNALTAAEAKIKSMTAQYKTSQNMDLGEGMKAKSDSEGAVAWMRKGDKKLMHTTMKMRSVQTIAGQETKMEQNATSIMDGEFNYTISEQDGQKSAVKMKADGAMDDSPKAFFAEMKEEHELKLLPDESVDGAACCVVEVVAKKSQDEPIAKQVFYFRRDSGVNVKMIGRDKADKVIFEHLLSDVKLDTEIPAEKFVFKAPEGVQVMDMTQPAPPAGEKP